MYYATLCAIAKDEDPFLVEWAEFHLRLGFEHIYIFDNNSAVPVRGTLRESVSRGLVTVLDWPLQRHQQLSAYAAALRDYGPDSHWMAFIDIDEFIVPRRHVDIRPMLDAYSGFGGLAMHWKIFGSGGLSRRPRLGVPRSYTGVIDRNPQIKSIVRPEAVLSVASPHHFRYAPGCWCVNEDKVPVLYHHSYHISEIVQVNHYYYKSHQDFSLKMKRGMATQAKDGSVKRQDSEFEAFARQHGLRGIADEAILRLLALQAGTDARPSLAEADSASRLGRSDASAGLSCGGSTDETGSPETWAVAARELLGAGRPDPAFTYITRLLRESAPCYQEEGYRCLYAYYLAKGRPEAAAAIAATATEG